MSNNFQWFKFSPASWMMGAIQSCSESTQGRFVNLCCIYWNKSGDVDVRLAQINLKESYDVLLDLQIISVQDGKICIDFLDEQLVDVEGKSCTKSESGKLGNLKRWDPELYDKVLDNRLTLKEALEIKASQKDSKSDKKLSQPDRNPIATRSQKIAEGEGDRDRDREENINIVRVKKKMDNARGIKHTPLKKGSQDYNLVRNRIRDSGLEKVLEVVEFKSKEWVKTDNAKYIRPSTLMRKSNFEKYLEEIKVNGNSKKENRTAKQIWEDSQRSLSA